MVQRNGTEDSGRFGQSEKRRQPLKVVLSFRKISVGVNRSICFPTGTTLGRLLETNWFPWYLTLVSANHATSNPDVNNKR